MYMDFHTRLLDLKFRITIYLFLYLPSLYLKWYMVGVVNVCLKRSVERLIWTSSAQVGPDGETRGKQRRGNSYTLLTW